MHTATVVRRAHNERHASERKIEERTRNILQVRNARVELLEAAEQFLASELAYLDAKTNDARDARRAAYHRLHNATITSRALQATEAAQ